MPTVWRIVPEHRAATAFDGEGARLFGGRWNSPGTRMVYTSESRSLAALEMLVHLPPGTIGRRWRLLGVELAPDWIETIPATRLPDGWRSPVIPAVNKDFGDAWVREARAPVLRIPSVIIPEEYNYLLNPTHPALASLMVVSQTPFAFDPRIVAK